MTKQIEITLHPREAEMLIEHLARRNDYPEIALKVAEQCVEQLSYSDESPLDWANDVRNLAYLRDESEYTIEGHVQFMRVGGAL